MVEQILNGKTAMVTGGGRGLGRAMALGLIEAGARVAIVDKDAQAVAETLSEAQAVRGKDFAIGLEADLADETEAARVVKTALTRFGSVSILVNNAGVGPEAVRSDFWERPIKFWEIPTSAWRLVFGINSDAAFFLIRNVAPSMIDAGWGRIINVTTSLDTMVRGGYSPYAGSKAAMEAHTAVLAQDLADTGVTANVLIPGGAANTRLIPFADRSALVQPDAMVPPLLWLLSQEANAVTGRRFLASLWDKEIPAVQAAEFSGAPAAWQGLPSLSRRPAGWDKRY
jgi:NAD(P)-dependent dehydrogenase (short-subunit alcohol dehydrogenase family)